MSEPIFNGKIALILMVISFGFCNVAVAPVKTEPAHKAEQSTQLLFGERVEILDINNRDWAKIRVFNDDYIGWCRLSQISIISRKQFLKTAKYIVCTNESKIVLPSGSVHLALGSELTCFSGKKTIINNENGNFKGKRLKWETAQTEKELIKKYALQFLNAPYQWGGRSIAGIDCSGFTQMVFKLCNFNLKRDAYQQATQGNIVDFLQNAQTGDLAFFDDKDNKIVHVGILLDNETIIHASDSNGRVSIDKIDQGGIISLTLKKRTHLLRLVKRYID